MGFLENHDKYGKEEISQFDQLIVKDFDLLQDHAFTDFYGNHALKQKLKMVIAYLLQNDFHRLVNAMYRLDIKESLFHEAMSFEDTEQVVDRLADIVFEREWQKVRARMYFKRNK